MKNNKIVISLIILIIIITIVFCLKSYATEIPDPGTNPGNETQTNPGEESGNETETNPGEPQETNPGNETETNPEENPGENPGNETETNPEENPGTNPGNETETNPGEPQETNPGNETEINPEENPGTNPGNEIGTNPNESTETPSGGNTIENPGTNQGANSTGNLGGNRNSNNNSVPTVAEVKSKNNNLQSLEVVGRNIEPVFEKNVIEYYLIVELDVEELEIIAVAEDEKASVEITGNTGLVEGENVITITVTAENGSKKEYKILITKTDNIEIANANLKSLLVSEFDIFPSFSSRIYNYNITIDKDIAKVEILAEAENENATIEIAGNENLKKGDNIITITVTAEDGITKRKYTINTYISTLDVEIQEENKVPAIIAIVILIVVILVLIIYIRNRKVIK